MHTDVADDKTTEDEDIWKLKHIETNEKDWKGTEFRSFISELRRS